MRSALLSAPAVAILVCALGFGSPLQDQGGPKQGFDEKEDSFKTEDGWTIHGTFSIPAGLNPREKVPAVVLIHSPAHDRDIYLGGHQVGPNTFAKLSLRSALGNTATLRIDIRGRGKSAEPQEYHSFTPEQRAQVAFDVSGAIEFLSHQSIVDPDRLGVVAKSVTAEPAVVATFKDRRIRALVLLSGRVGQGAKNVIASRDDLPMLCVASKEDKAGIAD